MTDYRYLPEEKDAIIWFGDCAELFDLRGIGVHATPPLHKEARMRKAKFVELGKGEGSSVFAPEKLPVQDENLAPHDLYIREVRALVHAAQFVQLRLEYHDGEVADITYCGPFYIEWAKGSTDG